MEELEKYKLLKSQALDIKDSLIKLNSSLEKIQILMSEVLLINNDIVDDGKLNQIKADTNNIIDELTNKVVPGFISKF